MMIENQINRTLPNKTESLGTLCFVESDVEKGQRDEVAIFEAGWHMGGLFDLLGLTDSFNSNAIHS